MNGQPIINRMTHHRKGDMNLRKNLTPEGTLAQSISRAASWQAYQTIRLLVDRDRVRDATVPTRTSAGWMTSSTQETSR